MSKPRLDPDHYLEALNAELRQHQYFRKGMTFVAFPEGTTGVNMSGYSVTGPYTLMGVYAEVAHKVADKYDLRV